ncbi:MAG: hypothetical protein JWM63_988 [Gammaproteobacteria bacterium]|nr:hypothetical protein [Gammaproteobacteria bacterium]
MTHYSVGLHPQETGRPVSIDTTSVTKVSQLSSYSPRIQEFRDDMIKMLPRAPNNRTSLESLKAMPTHRLILAFVTWRMRLIPAKPRAVRIWSGGVTPLQFQSAKSKLRPLLEKVTAGKDLTPHLSDLVHKKGVILPGARPRDRRQDIDMVLTREGLHHFHVGIMGPANPKGRSGSLVFAEVLDKEFRIVALSDHRAFEVQSAEQLRFFGICHAYMAKDIPPGQGFMANPVMSSGHSLLVTLFADRCDDEMRRLDPLLDDPAFIDKLYHDQPILRGGELVARPQNPSFTWYFEDLRFGILDTQTMVFFCIFPFFAR